MNYKKIIPSLFLAIAVSFSSLANTTDSENDKNKTTKTTKEEKQ